MTEDNKKDKKKEKETIKDRHDKIQTGILMEINNLLMDLNEKIDESHEELLEELGHKVDIPGYYKEDEELQKVRQKTGFDKEEDNFYDITDTITTAQVTDPDDFENASYNRERIFQVLDRYANSIYIANDGTDDLFVRISHHGTTTFSQEAIIRPGDVKQYWRVYELRLRSPTQGLPYRVTEYEIDRTCCPTSGITIIPVSGTVTANAGIDLNTSALALEAGGNLSSVKTNTDKLDVNLSTVLLDLVSTINELNTRLRELTSTQAFLDTAGKTRVDIVTGATDSLLAALATLGSIGSSSTSSSTYSQYSAAQFNWQMADIAIGTALRSNILTS